ncbi:MAG: hypothetical protein NVSMB2_19370 [Chloroflexota bacterium]
MALAHSSVSKALHVAETRTGFAFAEQRGRRIRLTSAGMVIAGRAQCIVQDVDDINQLADGMRAGIQGLIRIVASATPADYLLPLIIGEFIRTHADVRSVLRVSPLAELHQDLAEGEFDIGIGAPSPVPNGWEAEPLYEDAMTFVVAPGSPMASVDQIAWSDIRDQLGRRGRFCRGSHRLVGPQWSALERFCRERLTTEPQHDVFTSSGVRVVPAFRR